MRKAPSFLLLSVAVPALTALPVLSPPVAKPQPVTPEVRAVALAGVDDPSLRSSAGAASEQVSAEARADVLAPAKRGKAPSRPAVFTKARGSADFELLGVTWRAGTTADLTVLVRTHGESGWTEWTALEPAPTPDQSEGNDVRAGTEPLYAGPSDGYQVRIDVRSGTLPADVRVDLVDPVSPVRTPRSAPVPRWRPPPLRRRSPRSSPAPSGVRTSRCATGHRATPPRSRRASSTTPRAPTATPRPRCPRSSAASTRTTRRATAGRTSATTSSSTASAGSGRAATAASTKPVMGAHTGGFNTDTFAVSAIGNYDKVAAPAAMTAAIATVLGWKLSLHYRDPTGTTTLTSSGGGTSRYSAGTKVTIDVISAHRNMGYTSCPGNKLYALVPGIRTKVAGTSGQGSSVPASSWEALMSVSAQASSEATRSGGWNCARRTPTWSSGKRRAKAPSTARCRTPARGVPPFRVVRTTSSSRAGRAPQPRAPTSNGSRSPGAVTSPGRGCPMARWLS